MISHHLQHRINFRLPRQKFFDFQEPTALILSAKGRYPLRTINPPSLRSVVSPVRSVIAPPWLKPPSTILDGSNPSSISLVISSLIFRTDSNIPFSSCSFDKFPKEVISYLWGMFGEVETQARFAWAYHAGIWVGLVEYQYHLSLGVVKDDHLFTHLHASIQCNRLRRAS